MSLPRYPKYKDSGVEWLGEVPEHWEISRLGFESWVRARLGWKGLKAEEYVDDGFVFLSTPNIKLTCIDFDDVNYIDADRYEESPEIKLRVGDVLLAKDGSTLGTVNVVRFLPRPSTVNSSIAVITPSSLLDGIFLFYLFQSTYMDDTIQRIKGGMGVPHLFQADLNKFYIPVPQTFEQMAIAAFLDRETAKIDALVEEQRRLIELLKEKRQAVISHAVTKGLNLHAKMKPSGIEWLGDVPEHWDLVPLRFLVQFISGGTPDKKDSSYWDGPISWISSKDMKVAQIADAEDHISERAVIESGLKIIPAHHILIVVRGMILAHSFPIALTLGDVTINQDIKALKCASRLTPPFLQFVFEGVAAYIIANAGESAHGTKKLETEMLGKLPIPVPPVTEQDRIVADLHREIGLLKDVSISAQKTIDLLKERRTALISAAVTGKIDVRVQDTRPAVVSKLYTIGFARQLLAAEILHVCHNHPTTGRVKLQKLIHLCEHHAEIDEIHANYLRKVAGPFDNKLMFGVAAGLSKQKWYSEVKDGNRTIYRPLEKAGGHKKYLVRWGNKLPKVHQVLELLGKAQTQQCEIVSTLYAAWNDLLIEGRQPTDAEIVREASDPVRWHENKAKIPAEKWPRALGWMRDNGLVPKGYGSHTKRVPTAKENA